MGPETVAALRRFRLWGAPRGGHDMSDTQRLDAIAKLIEKHTRKATKSKAIARKTLIKEGIYTKDGQISEEFGGPVKKNKDAA